MEKANVSIVEYGPFGRCARISNGDAELYVTVDVGPRIIRYGFPGGPNMMCEAPDMAEANGWRIWGGHRMWHSPEQMPRSYEPDNDPVEWKEIPGGIHVAQRTESWARMRKEMDIALDSRGTGVVVTHRMTNEGAWPVECAIWALTVLSPGGVEIVPMSCRDTGLLSNRVMGLWPYTRMNDPRVAWLDRYVVLRQDAGQTRKFKFGINNEDGWAAYFNHGQAFVKRFEYDMEALYPDGGMNFETFTCHFMTEMESLSPLVLLENGESVEHEECWELIDGADAPACDDASIGEAMDKLLSLRRDGRSENHEKRDCIL
jgi:hypothetical protein